MEGAAAEGRVAVVHTEDQSPQHLRVWCGQN